MTEWSLIIIKFIILLMLVISSFFAFQQGDVLTAIYFALIYMILEK